MSAATFAVPPRQAACWYAAYVCVRHEKKVAEQLANKTVEHYLPLYTKAYRSKQRHWTAELPVFPGYVFVRMIFAERLRVLEIPSVVHLVSFGARAAVLSDEEIFRLRQALTLRRAEPHPYLAVGKRVRIQSGPLAGMEGLILRRKKQLRMVVAVESIHQAMSIELDASDLELIAPARQRLAPMPAAA